MPASASIARVLPAFLSSILMEFAAATVAADSACIGDGESTLTQGIISAVRIPGDVNRAFRKNVNKDSGHVNRGFRQKVNRKIARVGNAIHISE